MVDDPYIYFFNSFWNADYLCPRDSGSTFCLYGVLIKKIEAFCQAAYL